MFLIRFYWCLLKLHCKSLTTTPGQFWVVILSSLLDILVGMLTIKVVFMYTTQLAGWSKEEVWCLYGFWYLSFAFYHTFMNGVQEISNHLIYGTLDNILVRPLPTLFYLTSLKISPYGITGIACGMLIMVMGFVGAGVQWTLLKSILFFVFLASANLINYSIQLFLVSFSFVFGPTRNISWVFWHLVNLGRFPLDMFSPRVQRLLMISTIAFVSLFPVSYLLDKPGASLGLLTPIIATICFGTAMIVWRKGLEGYQSTGT